MYDATYNGFSWHSHYLPLRNEACFCSEHCSALVHFTGIQVQYISTCNSHPACKIKTLITCTHKIAHPTLDLLLMLLLHLCLHVEFCVCVCARINNMFSKTMITRICSNTLFHRWELWNTLSPNLWPISFLYHRLILLTPYAQEHAPVWHHSVASDEISNVAAQVTT